jgi:hypothetical protein
MNSPESPEVRVNRCIRDLERTNFWTTPGGTNCWVVNNVKISQTNDGLVRSEFIS